MHITLKHNNGTIWHPAKRSVEGADCYVLSNKNPLDHKDADDGSDEQGNKARFHIFCPDARSALNGLQAGLSIWMKGIGDNGKPQTNLFNGDRILFDNKPSMSIAP